MVIMAQARKTRKQWRPKAVIESAAAQHRTNADHLVTSYYQERNSMVNPVSMAPERTSITLPIDLNEPLAVNTPTALGSHRNSLMLKLSTPVLSPMMGSSGNITSAFGEQNDDEEGDELVLFVQHEQTNGNNKLELDNQIEILSTEATNFKTKNCSSQTDNDHHCHYPAKRIKTRLKKVKTNSDGSPVTAVVTTATNTAKVAKRKAYSRMKKERKATQTLIIVLSKLRRPSSKVSFQSQ